jgi:hypothetical protein
MRRSIRTLIVRGCLTLAAALAAGALAPAFGADDPHDTFGPNGEMYIGVDYYPEHWPRERWDEDARLMKEAGSTRPPGRVQLVLLEPEEGVSTSRGSTRRSGCRPPRHQGGARHADRGHRPGWPGHPETLAEGGRGRASSGVREEQLLFGRDVPPALRAHHPRHGRALRPVAAGHRLADRQEFGYGLRCHPVGGFRLAEAGTALPVNRAWGTHFGASVQTWDEIIPDSRRLQPRGARLAALHPPTCGSRGI